MDRELLQQLTIKVLDTSRPTYSLREEVLGIARVIGNAARFEIESERDLSEGETLGADGLALSPAMAALCAEDFVRTATFLRGLHQAIQTTLAASPRRPIRVLYAGCGPYGLLAVPLMSILSPEEVQFTLLDIHSESVASARAAIGALGFEASASEILDADACQYEIPRGAWPDIVVSETMNVALAKEPQVAIARHLLQQAPEAILVPESIWIDAALIDPSLEFEVLRADGSGETGESSRDRVVLGKVFELSAERVHSWLDETGATLPGGRIRLPDSLNRRHEPMLLTTIRVFGDHAFSDYQSGLTRPQAFPGEAVINAGTSLQFRYRLGENPGLTCEPLDNL